MKFYQGMGYAHRDYVVAIRSGRRRTRQNATAQHGIKSAIWRQAMVSVAVHCGLIALPAVLQRPPLIFQRISELSRHPPKKKTRRQRSMGLMVAARRHKQTQRDPPVNTRQLP